MISKTFKRREFFQLAFGAGIMGLAGCVMGPTQSILRASNGTLPKQWLRTLPASWRYKSIDNYSYSEDINVFNSLLEMPTDLLAISDGWLSTISRNKLRVFSNEFEGLTFDKQARLFLSNMDRDLVDKVLPVGVSPWAMIFRNGRNWIQDARNGWEVLLDPSLKGRIVLPPSPRLIISIAERIDLPNSLSRLREQVMTYDDRNSINWLLSDYATVAVVPLQRFLPIMNRDPRLSMAIPTSGSPLSWTLFLRPRNSLVPLPLKWIESSRSSPLLEQLLSIGWFPSLPQDEARGVSNKISAEFNESFLPSSKTWSRCWSLPPLEGSKKTEIEELWKDSSP